jgi:hypothetical protein
LPVIQETSAPTAVTLRTPPPSEGGRHTIGLFGREDGAAVAEAEAERPAGRERRKGS